MSAGVHAGVAREVTGALGPASRWLVEVCADESEDGGYLYPPQAPGQVVRLSLATPRAAATTSSSNTPLYRATVVIRPLLKPLFLRRITTTDAVGRAMLAVAQPDTSTPTALHKPDINHHATAKG